MALLLVGNGVTVVAVLLHELFDVLESPVEFVRGKQFTELQLAGIDDLARAGPGKILVKVDATDEVVRIGNKGKQHATGLSRLGFHPDVGETPGGVKRLDAGADAFTVQGFTRALGEQGAQTSFFLRRPDIRKVDCFHLGAWRLPRRAHGGPSAGRAPARTEKATVNASAVRAVSNPSLNCKPAPSVENVTLNWFDERANRTVVFGP